MNNTNICQIFKKNDKLFLWIPDIREIYIKLFINSSQNFKNTKFKQNCCNREPEGAPLLKMPAHKETASTSLLATSTGPTSKSLSFAHIHAAPRN